ncbi:AAA family ATPase [Streptococcus suis]|uniref:AAA family ATPase n=1 Tax=Streptococcus suis TaxID=1307 RepID=A0A6L8MWE4_STRSU|nr:AAA family ATPase [Streptococcus suis]
MFKKIFFQNFKSFSNLTFDLTNRGKSKNLVAIYGENGSGKSNIVDSFKLLRLSMDTMDISKKISKLQEKLQENENRENLPDINTISELFFGGVNSFYEVSKNTHRISANDNTKLVFEFNIASGDGKYTLEYNKIGEIISESLDYTINSQIGNHFKIDRTTQISIALNKTIFKKGVIKDLQEQIEKFWGKHTFLAIFSDYANSVNNDYLFTNISSNFIKVIHEFKKISIWTEEMQGPFDNTSLLLTKLDKGEINSNEKDKLLQTEEIIYNYFSAMYADIKDVRYVLDEESESIKYELTIYKNIGGELTEVPISLESNGTKKLLELLTVFLWAVDGRICVVDEIDTGIHDILMNNVLKSLSDCISGQLIFTTHDTALLKELLPSSAYFISIDVNGNKEIRSGNFGDKKVSPNNNMEKMYLEGFFGAIPEPLAIDFKELFSKDNKSEE